MDVLHHHLETIEATSFWNLDLSHESLSEIFEDDTIGGSEEGKHMLDKVLLVDTQLLPVLNVLSEVDFFSGPEGSLLVLVHAPDVVIPDREQHKAVRVLLQKRLGKGSLGLADSLRLRECLKKVY